MLESLMDIEIAYSFLSVKEEDSADLIDSSYAKLNCEIAVSSLRVNSVIERSCTCGMTEKNRRFSLYT